MKRYCPICGKEQEMKVVKKWESYPVKGEETRVLANVCTCTVCQEDVWDPDLDDENLNAAYREYRLKKGLLMPEEIKAIRMRYGVSQTRFAKILGLGEKTIARYENGSLQDEAQNNLILLASDPVNFQKLSERLNAKEDAFCLAEPITYSPFATCQAPYLFFDEPRVSDMCLGIA